MRSILSLQYYKRKGTATEHHLQAPSLSRVAMALGLVQLVWRIHLEVSELVKQAAR